MRLFMIIMVWVKTRVTLDMTWQKSWGPLKLQLGIRSHCQRGSTQPGTGDRAVTSVRAE